MKDTIWTRGVRNRILYLAHFAGSLVKVLNDHAVPENDERFKASEYIIEEIVGPKLRELIRELNNPTWVRWK